MLWVCILKAMIGVLPNAPLLWAEAKAQAALLAEMPILEGGIDGERMLLITLFILVKDQVDHQIKLVEYQ